MARVWVLLFSLAIASLNLAEADLPAIYIFGDSTVDVGTNNFLNESRARADQLFNGIDSPYSVPTGRFSNGYNTADMIVRLLDEHHTQSPPPFLFLQSRLATFRRDSMKGVNFASGGSGIFNDTGKKLYVKVIPLEEQILQFSTVCSAIREILGEAKTESLISNSLYLISVGSNDMFDYQLSSNRAPAETFFANLLAEYRNHLTNLYNLGARKFGVISVPAIGCCPVVRALTGDDCSEEMNALARAFYNSTGALLQEFSSQFQGVKYSLGNAYEMTMDIINNPLAFHFKEVKTACCGNGTFNGEEPCTPSAKVCPHREEYLFWDRFHPTQAATELAALTLYGGAEEFVIPMNFSQLALVDV